MTKIIVSTFKTPIGELLLGSFNDKLCLCDWKYRKMRNPIDNIIKSFLNTDYKPGTSSIIENTSEEINAYLSGELQNFSIPLLFCGTKFQQSVWKELVNTPYGKTISYLELSKKLNNEKAIRAVASANGANAISILVPCHRIIGSNGELTGYAGGLTAKKKLLELEGPTKQTSLF